eukprot:168954-Pyramimonas_sp.AAC.1
MMMVIMMMLMRGRKMRAVHGERGERKGRNGLEKVKMGVGKVETVGEGERCWRRLRAWEEAGGGNQRSEEERR